MSKRIFGLAAVAAVFFVAGCGGGGGGGGSSPLVSDTQAASLASSPGWSAPIETADQAEVRLAPIFARTNHFSMTPLVIDPAGTQIWFDSQCTGTACNHYYGGQRTGQTTLSELSLTDTDEGNAIASRNGVTILQFRTGSLFNTGAVLSHSWFTVQRSTVSAAASETLEALSGEETQGKPTLGGMAGGIRHGSPAQDIRATWMGAMTGYADDDPRSVLAGAANVTYNVGGRNYVVAEFKDIRNLSNGQAHPVREVYFGNVSVASDGSFAVNDNTGRINGGFYGPNQEEVAGTFHKNDIIGAFGASREPAE